MELTEESGIEISDRIKKAISLTDYAVKTRYPGDRDPIEEKEYMEAVNIAESVYDWVTEIIK